MRTFTVLKNLLMNKGLYFFLLLYSVLNVNAQTATSITNLQTPTLNESSGLIFYNNKLITHTDSGGEAKLYELNTTNGIVERTVSVTNATNYDWEDIAQDDSNIYIGDIGNNGGNRTNLKIYKIAKADYNNAGNTVTAEIISYSYANQTDFTENVNNNNWDAEAIISHGGKLLIFTKNWANSMTNVYSIPKTSGTHIAVLESSYNVNGLITGADSTSDESVIFLTGYSSNAAPFMYTIHNIPVNSLDVFSGDVSAKIGNIVPLGNQVEAVAVYQITPTNHQLYISNEKFVTYVGPIPFSFPAKLWNIEIDNSTLDVKPTVLANNITIYPNPISTEIFQINNTNRSISNVDIFDIRGKLVKSIKLNPADATHIINCGNLVSGVYFVRMKELNKVFTEKVIIK